MQLAHAGRKASTDLPWQGGKGVTPEQGRMAPDPRAERDRLRRGVSAPRRDDASDIDAVVAAFASAAKRAVAAGFQLLEIHGAHGYLLHEFLSPLSNKRTDEYGGSFENRIRFLRRVLAAIRSSGCARVRAALSANLGDRLGRGGWDLEQSCALVLAIKNDGVALVDVSSGGTVPTAKMPIGPGYQTPFAAEIRRRTGMPTGAVGMITSPEQADHIVRTGQADLVFSRARCCAILTGRGAPRAALGVTIDGPVQYGRAW
jgi:2,4-dienoyl-CoA reductase-like NADH-dependent reductase (Old Yellow Enzyme family)